MNSLKPSMLSECDLHCLDKICIWPLRLPLHTIRANIFRTCKIFPVSNADALTGFLSLWWWVLEKAILPLFNIDGNRRTLKSFTWT